MNKSLVEQFFDSNAPLEMMTTSNRRKEEKLLANTPCIKLGWVKAEIIEQLKGYTKGALDKKRQRGQLEYGVHWGKSDGVIVYNYEAIDQKLHDDATREVLK